MPQLIINADDFGFTDGVTEGIIRSIHEGVVTSTTAMACVAGAAVRLARSAPALPGRIGAHLQLTTGRALSDPSMVPTLCGADGAFPVSKKSLNQASTQEIVIEWEAQFRFLRNVGIEPTHIDTHHHVHKYPNAFKAFCEVAKLFNVPARALTPMMREDLKQANILCTDAMIVDFYGDGMTAPWLLELIDRVMGSPIRPETIEVMCHPSAYCEDLSQQSKYVQERVVELDVLCSPGLRDQLEDRGFSLIAYPGLTTSTDQLRG